MMKTWLGTKRPFILGVVVLAGCFACSDGEALTYVKTDTIVLRGRPLVVFDETGTSAVITTKEDPSRGFSVSIAGTGRTVLQAREGVDATKEPGLAREGKTEGLVFCDETGASITPMDNSINFRDQIECYPRPCYQEIHAQFNGTSMRLTPEGASGVSFFDYDPLSHRALIYSGIGYGYRWYCYDLEQRQRRFLDVETIIDPTGDLNDHIPQHCWMIPGEDLILFLLRRCVWDDRDYAYRLAICDLEGNVLGALPMPEYRDSGYELFVSVSAHMIVVGAMRREVHVFVKVADDAVPHGLPSVRLEPSADLLKAAQHCGIDIENMFFSLASHPERNVEPCPAPSPVEMVTLPIEGGAKETTDGVTERFIGKYEITTRQFAAALNWAVRNNKVSDLGFCVGDTEWGELWQWFDDPFSQMLLLDGQVGLRIREGRSAADLPVLVGVYSAAAFCNWLSEMEGKPTCYAIDPEKEEATLVAPCSGGYRLPTVEEWRVAAGVTNGAELKSATPWLNDVRERGRRSNCDDNNPLGFRLIPYLTPVGYFDGSSPDRVKTVSPVGCFDVFGNASELCHVEATPGTMSLTSLGGAWDDGETLERKPNREDGFRVVCCGNG